VLPRPEIWRKTTLLPVNDLKRLGRECDSRPMRLMSG
jgi:hypothetical protein